MLSPRRSQPRSLTSRQAELLEQLEELVLAVGFADLTLDDIATELRCAKVTLYNLAPSREQLNLTVLRRFFDAADRRIRAKLHREKEPRKKVRTLLAAIGEEMSRMEPVCFADLARFQTTYELYDSFAQTQVVLLVELLEAHEPRRRNGPTPSAVGEVVRVGLDDIYSGEFERRTGISRERSLHDIVMMVSAVFGDNSRRSARDPVMRRVK
jgi:AcrR family transcriptional regulator